MRRLLIAGLILVCLEVMLPVCHGQDSQTKAIPNIDGLAFDGFETTDRFGRTIRFYLSRVSSDDPLPLVICIQGSGGQSVFVEVDTPDGKRIGSTGTEAVVLQKFRTRTRVLVVEKPGIEFLFQPDRPGSAEDSGDDYNREFSLDRWVEAINAALNAAVKLPGVDDSKILALGHSEGGHVACELGAINAKVTHVANMAGGGPTQLFDLMIQARSGDMYDPDATASERVDALMADWQKVMDAPLATDRFILGHSHLRWSSFLKSSPIEAILKSDAKVFVASGTSDTNSLPASSDAFCAALLARGRDCTYERIEGANHGFMMPDDKTGKGWIETNSKAIEWFLNSK